MNEKRFELEISSFSGKHMKFLNILDNGKRLNSEEIVELLNEQQATIQQLKAQLKQKEQEERLYANEILKLNKEAKEVLDFKSLGGDY